MQEAAGGLQLCVGLESGAEAGIHAMRSIFENEDTQSCLFDKYIHPLSRNVSFCC